MPFNDRTSVASWFLRGPAPILPVPARCHAPAAPAAHTMPPAVSRNPHTVGILCVYSSPTPPHRPLSVARRTDVPALCHLQPLPASPTASTAAAAPTARHPLATASPPTWPGAFGGALLPSRAGRGLHTPAVTFLRWTVVWCGTFPLPATTYLFALGRLAGIHTGTGAEAKVDYNIHIAWRAMAPCRGCASVTPRATTTHHRLPLPPAYPPP